MKGSVLEARNLTKTMPKGAGQLRDFSLNAGPRELIAIVNLDDGSQVLLLEVLSGQTLPSQGQVLVDGANIYKSRGTFSKEIGFIPCIPIVHKDLTVFEAIDYASRLRLPKGTTRTARRQRVDEVIADLDLDGLRSRRVKTLDAEQYKLVSIGVELIANPGILLLDDPAYGLPLNKEVKLMHALRKLAGQGRSVVLTTRSLSSMLLADQLAIILPGGYEAWFGPLEEAVSFFNTGQPLSDEDGKLHGFAELFEELGSASESEAKEWAERYRAHPASKRYLSAPQQDKGSGILLEERPLARMREKQVVEPARPAAQKVSALGQFTALSSRNLKVLLRDRVAVFLIFIAPLLAAVLDLVFSDRNMYDMLNGSSEKIMLSLAGLVFLVMLFAGFSWVREYRKEASVIHRERQAALKLLPYVFSKVWIVALFALYQGLVWTGIHYLIANVPGGLSSMLLFFITLASVALVGGILGLLSSALARTVAGASVLLFLLALLQLLFSGGLRQIPVPPHTALDWVNPSRLAFEALVTAGGHGQVLFLDACLNQPEKNRRAMTEDEKNRLCSCLGANLFTKCRFPGIGKFFTPELAQPVPEGSGDQLLRQPPQPVYSPDKSPEEYSTEVDQYTSAVENYWLAQNKTIEDQTRIQVTREVAVQNAESLIKNEYDRYRDIFYVFLPGRWAALWISAVVLTVIFAGVMKRKDA